MAHPAHPGTTGLKTCKICQYKVIGYQDITLRPGEPKLEQLIDCVLDEARQPILDRIRKNITYCLGSGVQFELLSEAAEALFNRDDYKGKKQIFVPECFLTKDPTMIFQEKEKLEKLLEERKRVGDLPKEEEHKWKCKIKTLEGEIIEKRVYDTLKTYFQTHQSQEVLVLHGYEIMDLEMLKSQREITHGEKDFIIINFTYGYILNIEVKKSLDAKSLKDAKRQLEETKNLFTKWFGADVSASWQFISAIYCERDDKTNKTCKDCDMNFIFTGSEDLVDKLEKIHRRLMHSERF